VSLLLLLLELLLLLLLLVLMLLHIFRVVRRRPRCRVVLCRMAPAGDGGSAASVGSDLALMLWLLLVVLVPTMWDRV
jgi:hypothetical protein